MFAAAGELRAAGWLGQDERVVAFDTGIGAKYPPPPLSGRPPVVDPDAFDPDEVVAALDTAAG